MGSLTRTRAVGQELHVARVAPLLLLQSFRLFLHLQLLNPGLDGRQLLIKRKNKTQAGSHTDEEYYTKKQ